jgi:hypothetical protein
MRFSELTLKKKVLYVLLIDENIFEQFSVFHSFQLFKFLEKKLKFAKKR